MEVNMYKFSAIKNMNDFFPGSKIANLQLFSEYNEVKIQGILKTLFGEPLYETGDYEDAYCYFIEAKDEKNSSKRFNVYQGCSGCAIGASGSYSELKEVIDQFIDLLKNTNPSDFLYEGVYMDADVKIRQGIKNGEIIYEEMDLDDDV